MVAALSGDCSITWVDDPGEIDAAAWDALLPAEGASPFLRHAFFQALHDTGSAAPATGWHPQFLLLHDAAGRLRAACQLALKAWSAEALALAMPPLKLASALGRQLGKAVSASARPAPPRKTAGKATPGRPKKKPAPPGKAPAKARVRLRTP